MNCCNVEYITEAKREKESNEENIEMFSCSFIQVTIKLNTYNILLLISGERRELVRI